MTSPYRGDPRCQGESRAALTMKVVMVAVDATSEADAVLRAAATLAERFEAEIVLYRAVALPAGFPAGSAPDARDPLPSCLQRQARDDLRALATHVPSATLALPLVSVGDPWRAILAMAEQVHADVLVVGSRAHGGLRRLLETADAGGGGGAGRHVFVVHEGEAR